MARLSSQLGLLLNVAPEALFQIGKKMLEMLGD
jgi:hypothetical protein